MPRCLSACLCSIWTVTFVCRTYSFAITSLTQRSFAVMNHFLFRCQVVNTVVDKPVRDTCCDLFVLLWTLVSCCYVFDDLFYGVLLLCTLYQCLLFVDFVFHFCALIHGLSPIYNENSTKLFVQLSRVFLCVLDSIGRLIFFMVAQTNAMRFWILQILCRLFMIAVRRYFVFRYVNCKSTAVFRT